MTCLTTTPSGGNPVKLGNGVHVTADAAVPEPAGLSLAALLPDLQPHPELDLKTLAYHLQQSDATAADGYHHAAVNEARSFVEALIISIVRVVQQERSNKQAGNGSPNGTAFRMYRRHLAEAGLISADENDLLQGIYSMASAKGSHQGVTDATWTRLARQIVFATGQYLVRRYVDWKQAGRPIAPPTVVARGGFWRWLRTFMASSR